MKITLIHQDTPDVRYIDMFEAAEHLESDRGATRYALPDGETAWFCDECGAEIDDTFEGCECCEEVEV